MYLAKDFIETAEGLVFAVVESGLEQEKVLCFLRYILVNDLWQKVDTNQANQFLEKNHPHYLYFSPSKQAHCHAVAIDNIFQHHQPREKLQQLLLIPSENTVENDLLTLCKIFSKQGFDISNMGVTGSILISAQNKNSDIDCVFYSRKHFNQARKIVQELINTTECSELNTADWLESYDRRCCDLSYDEYVWHEKRKFNKALINNRKFDLSFVIDSEQDTTLKQYKKLQSIKLKVQVTDDKLAYDYPSEYSINDSEITTIVCYTATYTGQAVKGEWIEVAGQVELATNGEKRIIVGSSREAKGEYIKVVNES